jgi:hypothetical protein
LIRASIAAMPYGRSEPTADATGQLAAGVAERADSLALKLGGDGGQAESGGGGRR